MPFGSRRRALPPTTTPSTLLHRILALVGLGPEDTDDAEGVFLVADRLSFVTLFDNVDAGEHHSAWHSCRDRSIIRFFVEYGDPAETRNFVIALKAHLASGDGDYVAYSRIVEPTNEGLSHDADMVTVGRFKALDGGEMNVNCFGMAEFKLILLAKPGGTTVDAYAGVC